jgi:hypothetical protein
MRLSSYFAASLAATLMCMASAAQAATPSDPAVVELFTSQGCSSCPPANANLIQLANRPDVLALSFDVTYWDYLGWKDTFDSPAYTERQRDYESPLGESGPFTPQVVVDGSHDTVGNVRGDIEKLIAQSHRADAPPVTLSGDKVSIGAGPGTAEVWLVRYDPHVVQIPISRGENSGTTQPQTHVVHALADLGAWHGEPANFALTPAATGLKTAVLLQRGRGGPIVAVARD